MNHQASALSKQTSGVPDLPPIGIRLRNVSLVLGGHAVFTDLSLQLEPSQWHCVLGRSGVGKSSLLRLISGLTIPNEGSVSTPDGQSLFHHVAHMSQDDGLLPWLTVLDNVRLGPRLRGCPVEQYREPALAILHRLGLGDWVEALPERLSGGMRQRVALARTLLEKRPVVLMDEPFSRLDAITRRELQSLAFAMLKDRTVVLVTHDPHEALRVGHTITVLHDRQSSSLLTQTLPDEPLREHDNAAVTQYLPILWRLLQEETVSP